MDMIRWLATNKVVLTVWGLGILAILLASIFGGGKKVEPAAALETKAVETVVEASAEVSKPVVAAVAATGAAATTAVLAAVDTATETTEEVVDKVAEVATDAEAKVADAVEEVSDAVKVESQEVSEASSELAVTEASDLSGKSSDDLLMMAREAYWDNGLDKAASLYSELITREPTVFEHKGELGNVFWRQGYPKKAAELYADIAEPMIAGGNGERVSNMVGFIGLFFPERATSIRKLLDAQ
jgi:hypothetical protein